ncbi:hypothetical protein WMF39_44140 [Sorangium sp. So ce1504]|uniref:hypothetical protein n=1 Tax=unclassified Sorangium TaxID=2621164 RepID=UPI003F62EACA
MGVPCMPVRPSCFVQSIDLHGALGTLIAPPAPPVPFTPSDITMWFAFSNTHYGTGDRPVASVLICGEPAINKGADTKENRPHLVIIGAVPPNVVVGPIVDLGFFVLVIMVGATKPVWGPTTVKAGGKSVAVIAVPYSPFCPFNQLVCTDPFDMPLGISMQAPTSVFAGMSLADYLLCMASIAVDMLLSFLLNLLFGGLKGTGKFFGKRVFKAIMRRIAPKLRGLLGKGLAPVFDWIVEKVSEKVGKVLGEQAGEAIGKWLGKTAEEKAKKATSDKLGGLSPDDLLGFGNDPPLWAR